MKNRLALRAKDFTGADAVCEFSATADGITTLTTNDPTEPVFEIPPGTNSVEVTFKPRRPIFWEKTFSFSVAPDGSLTADVDFRRRVELTNVPMPPQADLRFTVAVVKVSQFEDRTQHVLELLTKPPTERRIFNVEKKKWEVPTVDEVKAHKLKYGTVWPPADWSLHDVPGVRFIDAGNPLTPSRTLNFARDPSLHLDNVECVVLERKGVRRVPQYFAVAWPPPKNANPRQFLLFIPQYLKANAYNLQGMFTMPDGKLAPYADSFDYADFCLFDSLHFARSPFWDPNAKGVPYQVAKARADVVTVIPCTSFWDGFGDLDDPEDTEAILKEVQAFMFWKGGVVSAPTSVGNTAVAAFSAGNFFLGKWLKNDIKRKGHFLKSIVRAIYFLEPMRAFMKDGKRVEVLDDFVDSALTWAGEGIDKRIRLYMQYEWPSLQRLMDKPLGSPPFFHNASDGTRTVSVVTNSTWTTAWNEAWNEAFGRPFPKALTWLDIHHAICGTMLTHALSQGDFEFA